MNTKIKEFIEKYYWTFFAGILIFLGFLCFFKLGIYNINDWDEARHGVNAYEMLKNNNYIANYYGGSLDYWNLKPPISYYTIMLGFKIFGYNPFGLRFFSALAFIALVVIVALFVKKKQSKIASLICMLLFCGSFFFFYKHFVRTGDADAIFVLFVGVAIVSLCLSSDNSNWLHLTFFMFALAFLTKSWHAAFLLPIIFFYYLFTKAYKKVKWWQYITCILCAVAPILIWALARYGFDGTKFFEEMLFYDLLNRSSNAIESHVGYPFYYTVQLIKNPIQFVCLVLLVVAVIRKLVKKQKLSNIDKVCLISFLSIFFIFAIAKTKLFWYIYPACTPLIIAGSIYACEFYKELANKKVWQNVFKYFMIVVASCCMVVSVVMVSINKPVEMQTFISNLNIKDSVVYYEVNNSTTPAQADLLCAELSLDIILQKDGGYAAFEQEGGSYIIMTKAEFYAKSAPDTIKVVSSSENYVLCYNSAT